MSDVDLSEFTTQYAVFGLKPSAFNFRADDIN
jgi:hypothetical protein